MEIDSIRMQLLPYRNYCQDILEARLRAVLYEQLNISRDITFDWVVRLDGEGWRTDRKPILASLTNQADKWEILCLARHVSIPSDKVVTNLKLQLNKYNK